MRRWRLRLTCGWLLLACRLTTRWRPGCRVSRCCLCWIAASTCWILLPGFCAAALLAADVICILLTSREPLGLPEEARYRLSPLALPDSP